MRIIFEDAFKFLLHIIFFQITNIVVPGEEVDEEGFTAKEAEVHEKVFGRDHRITLFCA